MNIDKKIKNLKNKIVEYNRNSKYKNRLEWVQKYSTSITIPGNSIFETPAPYNKTRRLVIEKLSKNFSFGKFVAHKELITT